MVNPDGSAYYASPYGSPSSFGMGDAFYHFWLAERQDVVGPALKLGPDGQPIYPPVAVPLETIGGVDHYLPLQPPSGAGPAGYAPPVLKGRYAVVTVAARTGRLVSTESPPTDDPVAAVAASRPLILDLPYRPGMQGQP